MEEIIRAVKQKRELAGLDERVVRESVERVLKRERRGREKLAAAKSWKEFSRSKEWKVLKRDVREELRGVYGLFQGRFQSGGSPEERLASHQSSAERLPFYEEAYQRIFSITGAPRSLLDLGCGANPYSYGKLGCTPFYVAVDLPNKELERIAAFFKEEGIAGEVVGLNLVSEYRALRGYRHVDVAFLFKLLDSLEHVKRNISGELLDAINATWLVVSFPTVSVGGRKLIRKERRAWFERLLRRRGWRWEEFSIENEHFYIIVKQSGLAGKEKQREAKKKC